MMDQVGRTLVRMDQNLAPLFGVTWFFFSSRRRHTSCLSDWSSDVCSSDLAPWAARGPFELTVLPREHRSIFEQSTAHRSEERRVGKECRSRGEQEQERRRAEKRQQCAQDEWERENKLRMTDSLPWKDTRDW